MIKVICLAWNSWKQLNAQQCPREVRYLPYTMRMFAYNQVSSTNVRAMFSYMKLLLHHTRLSKFPTA